jgi:hypothetical protein
MSNVIVGLIIFAIIGASITKIIIEKRKGTKCIGCPYSHSKNSKCNCNHLK